MEDIVIKEKTAASTFRDIMENQNDPQKGKQDEATRMTDQMDPPTDPRRNWRQTFHPWSPASEAAEATGALPLEGVPRTGEEPFELPDPEDFIPADRIAPSGFELMPVPGSAWLANIALASMVFACMINWSWSGKTMPPMVASGAAVFQKQEYWRLFTALLGHGDVMHLLHNAPIFWFFAWILNAYFGLWVAGFLTLIVGLASNAVTLWSYEPNTQLLGASGMIYGMVAMWLVLYIRFDRKGWWVKRVVRSLGFSLLVLFPQTYEVNTSYMAHASGFLIGIVLAVLWMPFAMRFAPVRHDPYYRPSEQMLP